MTNQRNLPAQLYFYSDPKYLCQNNIDRLPDD